MTFEEMKAQYCGKNIRKKPKHEEDDLQRACVCWFDLQYPQYSLIMNKDNIIPPMTHPYGMCWQQPPTYLILIDDTHAVMSRLDFEILMDYTCSRPSALYNGKMWKAQYENEGALKWFLCYCFNENEKTNEIDIAYREILIID